MVELAVMIEGQDGLTWPRRVMLQWIDQDDIDGLEAIAQRGDAAGGMTSRFSHPIAVSSKPPGLQTRGALCKTHPMDSSRRPCRCGGRWCNR